MAKEPVAEEPQDLERACEVWRVTCGVARELSEANPDDQALRDRYTDCLCHYNAAIWSVRRVKAKGRV